MIAVGFNYADHIAEMKRTAARHAVDLVQSAKFASAAQRHDRDRVSRTSGPISKPSWPSSSASARRKSGRKTRSSRFSATPSEKTSAIASCRGAEAIWPRCKSFDTYTPVGPFVYTDVDVRAILPIEAAAKRRGETKRAHKPDDLSGRRKSSLYEPRNHSAPGRPDLDRDTLGRGSDSAPEIELQARIGDWPPLQNLVTRCQP